MRKSLLKTIVATAVVGATMALSSVAAWAGINTYYWVKSDGAPDVNESVFTNVSGLSSSSMVGGSFSFTGEDTSYTPTNSIKANGGISVTFKVEGEAEVELVAGMTSATGALNFAIDGKKNETTVSGKNYQKVNFTVSQGTHTITRNNGNEGRLYGIRIIDTVPDGAVDYTVNGQINLANTEIILDGNTLTTDNEGRYTYIKKGTSSPFSDGGTLTISVSQYTGDSETVTLTDNGDNTYTASTVTFTKTPLTALVDGQSYTYTDIQAGRPNFNIDNATISGGKISNGSTVVFLLDKKATVELKIKSGSTDVMATFNINGNKVAETDSATSTVTETITVPAGLTELTFSSASETGTGVVQSLTVTYSDDPCFTVDVSNKKAIYIDGDNAAYLVVGITQEEYDTAPQNAKLGIYKGTDGSRVLKKSNQKVYTKVKVTDGSAVVELNAADINAAYVYGLKVANQPTLTLADFSGGIVTE